MGAPSCRIIETSFLPTIHRLSPSHWENTSSIVSGLSKKISSRFNISWIIISIYLSIYPILSLSCLVLSYLIVSYLSIYLSIYLPIYLPYTLHCLIQPDYMLDKSACSLFTGLRTLRSYVEQPRWTTKCRPRVLKLAEWFGGSLWQFGGFHKWGYPKMGGL